jgi:hypothetical protein
MIDAKIVKFCRSGKCIKCRLFKKLVLKKHEERIQRLEEETKRIQEEKKKRAKKKKTENLV